MPIYAEITSLSQVKKKKRKCFTAAFRHCNLKSVFPAPNIMQLRIKLKAVKDWISGNTDVRNGYSNSTYLLNYSFKVLLS